MKIFKKQSSKQRKNIPLPIDHKWSSKYYYHQLSYNCTRCNQAISKHYPFKDDKRYFWVNRDWVLEQKYMSYFRIKEEANIFINPCYSILMDEALK